MVVDMAARPSGVTRQRAGAGNLGDVAVGVESAKKSRDVSGLASFLAH